jgi:hypothetical protein
MNQDEHVKRHLKLHTALDELAADYLVNNKGKLLSTTSIIDLMKWSCEQTKNPSDKESHGLILRLVGT